jgi:Ala-tRNA(Pro) deacylase
MSTTVNTGLIALLEREGVPFQVLKHAPTSTSEDSARERGCELRLGAKALVLKTDNAFALFVLSAADRLSSPLIKKRLSVGRVRFATRDELERMTGLPPGAVPPFGRPVLPLDLYADTRLFKNDVIAFNAGSLTESIILSAQDYLRVAQAEVFPFAVEN